MWFFGKWCRKDNYLLVQWIQSSFLCNMIHQKLESEVWQKSCEKDCEKSWTILFGDYRKYARHTRRHFFKYIVIVLMTFAMISVVRTNKNRTIDMFTDMSLLRVNLGRPLIVVITPTYKRPTRLPDLTRMANTLRLVSDVHWIVVEDSEKSIDHVERLLNRTGLPYTYIAAKTAKGYPKRGWYQRTIALNYLRANRERILNGHSEGVLYFGDDDNAYDTRLFDEYLRNVKKVGLWAVGMVGGAPVESLDVVNGSVVGFKVKWNPKRKFAVDMAGFGINLRVVFNSTAVFGTSCPRGGGAPETCLLEDMGLFRKDIEPFGYDTEFDRDIMVWHTKSCSPGYPHSDLNGYIYEWPPPKNATVPAPEKTEEKKLDDKKSAEKKEDSDKTSRLDEKDKSHEVREKESRERKDENELKKKEEEATSFVSDSPKNGKRRRR